MRISELAQRADVTVSAVKYYQREGLLPEGERSAPNQVSYSEAHVHRVRLVRALMGAGGLTIAATKEVVATLDDAPLAETFYAAQQAMSMQATDERRPSTAARETIVGLVQRQGWAVCEDNPGIDAAARAIDGLAAVNFVAPESYLAAYATAAATAAEADLRALTTLSEPAQIAELMVVGTVLGDPLFAGLRRLAQEDASHHVFPVDQAGPRS